MKVRFADKDLERLETDPAFDAGYPQEVVRKFRQRILYIRNATDERDIRAMKSFHYEKLKGARSHQRSLRLNKKWRMIVEIETDDGETVVVVSIEDYH